MSDSTATSQSTSTPSLHHCGDSATRGGTATQLISHLDDCRAQLTNFSDEMSRELNDILSFLSPEKANRNSQGSTASVIDTVETLPLTSTVNKPPELPPQAPRLEESVPRTTELNQPSQLGDEQTRLAALKARIADRLRNELDSSEVVSQQGADQ